MKIVIEVILVFLGILFLTTEVLLAFSIIVSMKTCVLSRSKLVNFGKEGFLPTLGKIFLILTSMSSILARVSSLLLYFGPSLGLLDLMHHWKWEKTRYRPKSAGGPYSEGGNLTWYNVSLPWDDIERIKTLHQLEPTSYSIYTGITVKWLYAILIGGIFIHISLVYALKNYSSRHFR